jgi:hypothetical protein
MGRRRVRRSGAGRGLIQHKGDADALTARARIGDHGGETLDLAGQDRGGVDADDGVADLGAVGVQQGDTHRQGDPFVVATLLSAPETITLPGSLGMVWR